jgi:hypothetical protein
MTCDMALERMLEAEPAALRGEDGSELARHIVGCDRCAAVAATLLDELDAVDAALADLAADGTDSAADAAADAALAAVRAGTSGDVPPLDARTRTPHGARVPAATEPRNGEARRRWPRRAWVPLAAAAGLATVLVLAREDRPVPGPAPERPAIGARVSVVPPTDRGAAIMETANPNITIVWLYEREES